MKPTKTHAVDIKAVLESIIEGGRTETRPELDIDSFGGYRKLASALFLHPLPTEIENQRLFLKGLVLLENSLMLDSGAILWRFVKRLNARFDRELVNWIHAHRIVSEREALQTAEMFARLQKGVDLERDYELQMKEKAERKRKSDAEARRARKRREKNRIEHAERKRLNDAERVKIKG